MGTCVLPRRGVLVALAWCLARTTAASAVAASNRTYDFTALRQYLDFVAPFYGNLSMTIGDSRGAVFSYSNVKMTPSTVLGLASGSKWPGVTALVACFVAHNVSFDTKMSALLDWWTSDPQDGKSSVTLRHVLSMTTGLISEGDAASNAYSQNCSGLALPECAEVMYAELPAQPYQPPGTLFMYSTFGFQFAAAAAVAVENDAPIAHILETYLLQPAGMAPTCFWAGMDLNPVIGGGLMCDAFHMNKFNHAMLTDKLVDEATRTEMETVRVTPDMYNGGTAIFGPYCMGNWLECLNNGQSAGGTMPSSCFAANRHGHPGCGGYWNFVDRSQGVYLNFLPSYECTQFNNYCDSPQGDHNCPPLYGWAFVMRTVVGFYMDQALLVH